MRTYSRDSWFEANEAWGSFTGSVWNQVRRAVNGWTIFPPSMDGADERDAEHPSQRVIVWFAMTNRPQETLQILWRSKSWREVCDQIFAAEGGHRDNARWGEEAAEMERRYERQQYHGAMQSVGSILSTWKDSAA